MYLVFYFRDFDTNFIFEIIYILSLLQLKVQMWRSEL